MFAEVTFCSSRGIAGLNLRTRGEVGVAAPSALSLLPVAIPTESRG